MTTLSPLHQRVEAPHRLETPIHPDIALWRPLTADDARELAALHRAADAADHPEWIVAESELADTMSLSYVDLAHDSIAAVTDSGRIAAYGVNIIDQHPETIVRVRLDGAIHPDFRGRGLGRQLLQWQRGRAQQLLANCDLELPGWVLAWESTRNPQGIRLAELLGFHAAREIATVIRDLAAPIAPPEPEPSVRIVPWDPALSAATRDAHTDTYRDHWGSQPLSDEAWHDFVAGPFFRPDLSWLAVDAEAPDTVVGFVLASVHEADFAARGHAHCTIDPVGTRRDWRGRGVAKALLAQTLIAARERGLENAVLSVDTEDATGAVAMYSGLGFVPEEHRQVAMLLVY